MNNQNPIEDMLNRLNQSNYEAERFCEFGYENSSEEEHKSFFLQTAKQHKTFRAALVDALSNRLGRIRESNDVFSDAIDEMLWDLGNLLSTQDEQIMLKKHKSLETTLLKHYNNALQKDLPLELQSLLMEQQVAVEGIITETDQLLEEEIEKID